MAKVSDKRLAEWLEQVAEGLDAGMQASDAVALAKALPQGVSSELQASLESGNTWGKSFEAVGHSFSFAELSILKASEVLGRLPIAMRRLAEARRDQIKVKRRVNMALAYPVFLLHFAALVFSISYLLDGDLLGFAVSAGMVLVPFWLVVFFFIAVARTWPNFLVSVARGLPVFSGYRKNWEAGVLCDVLGSSLAAGMSVASSWEIAANAADSPRLYRVADCVLASVSSGGKVSQGLQEAAKDVPNGFSQIYKNGEETGRLEQNLEAASKRYSTDAKNKLFLAGLLYPKLMMLCIVGYVLYKIIGFFSGYFEELSNISV